MAKIVFQKREWEKEDLQNKKLCEPCLDSSSYKLLDIFETNLNVQLC